MNTLRTFFVLDGVVQRVRVAVTVAVIAALAAVGVVAWNKTHGLPSDAAFKFGGTVVTTSDLDQRIKVLGALYGVQQPTDSAKVDKFRRAAAQADAMTLILDKAATSAGIVISDKSARDTLTQMLGSQLGSDPQQSFDAILTKFGVSENDVLVEIKRQQAIALLFRQETKSASGVPSSSDVATYFQQHTSDFSVPAKRHLLNIVVKTRADAATVVRAARVDQFSALARRYSLDDSTRSKGGNLGTVSATQLAGAYAKAAFAARIGSVFGPIKTSHGWNVGKVVSGTAGRAASLATSRAQVIANMRSERALDAWRSWLTAQVTAAHITYADAYRPADPNALPAIAGVPTASTGGTGQ
jgi:peptidyl-prolyl cis-trans isomerase C